MGALPQRPTTADELAAAVADASRAGEQARVQGSGSLPLSRFDPLRPCRDISTLRLNKVLDHAVSDMTVTVQAGISLDALQRELAWHNQWLPVDPPCSAALGRRPGTRTIAGLIATHSLGPLRELDAGTNDWRRLLLGMRWVDAAGALIRGGGRTMKNAAGYQLPRLMIGAAGTLGAIAEVTLRTGPRPEDEMAATFFCDSSDRAAALIAAIRLAPVTPACIEAVAAPAFAGNPLQLPALAPGAMAVIVGFLGRAAACRAQIDALRELPEAQDIESLSHGAAQAGRLRLWLTTEPPADLAAGVVGFRMHLASTRVCAAAAAIAGDGAWVVAEAGAGVVRGVAPLQSLRRAGAAFIITQNRELSPPETPAPHSLLLPLKNALDPANTFGSPPPLYCSATAPSIG